MFLSKQRADPLEDPGPLVTGEPGEGMLSGAGPFDRLLQIAFITSHDPGEQPSVIGRPDRLRDAATRRRPASIDERRQSSQGHRVKLTRSTKSVS